MKISIIAAISEDGVIGDGNDLLWRLPNDMAFFKHITSHHPVIMGRKTYESIPEKFRPLKDRTNIVLSRSKPEYSGAHVVETIEEALEFAKDISGEVFIAGGGQIYKEFIDMADCMYITGVHGEFEGDTKFPDIEGEPNDWKQVFRADFEADSKNKYTHRFSILERIK